jgi:hypothetical protein
MAFSIIFGFALGRAIIRRSRYAAQRHATATAGSGYRGGLYYPRAGRARLGVLALTGRG